MTGSFRSFTSESMAADCNELIALLISSIKTIKNNNK
jgi:hypothetical protein